MKTVLNYFQALNATIDINPNIDKDAIYEYLDILIQDGTLEIPGFKLCGYSASQFNEDIAIHSFYYEQTNKALTYTQIISMLNEHPLLAQDDSQPKPNYIYYCGSLYITIIGEA